MTVRADPEPGPEPDANADAHGDPDPDPDADASAAPSKYGYGRSYGDSSHYGTGYRGGHGIQCHGMIIGNMQVTVIDTVPGSVTARPVVPTTRTVTITTRAVSTTMTDADPGYRKTTTLDYRSCSC